MSTGARIYDIKKMEEKVAQVVGERPSVEEDREQEVEGQAGARAMLGKEKIEVG